MEENKINFFAIPVFSFIPPKYKKLIHEKPGKVFGILLICFLVMYLITAVRGIAGVDKFAEEIREDCPDFTLANGTFSCDTPIYYNEGGYIFVIDGSIADVSLSDVQDLVEASDKYLQGAFIAGAKSIVVYDPSQGYQELKYSDLEAAFGGNMYITKDSVFNNLIPIIKGFMFVVMIFAALILLGWHYFACLILQLITYIGECVFKCPLESNLRYRTTVLAKIPSVLIGWFLTQINVSIPGYAKIVITALFALLAVYYMKKQNEEESTVMLQEQQPEQQPEQVVFYNSNEPKAIDFFGTTNFEQSTDGQQNTDAQQN